MTNAREPASEVLRLRHGLVCRPLDAAGEACWSLEDPARGKLYSVGWREYTLLSLLDGHVTLGEAWRQSTNILQGNALSEQEAVAIGRFLVETGLAMGESPRDEESTAARRTKSSWSCLLARWNPLFVRLPLVNPDRCLASLLPWLGWTVGRAGFVAWLAVCVTALLTLAGNWTDFGLSSRLVLDAAHWPWLFLLWVGLKLVHETWHGLACKRHGGSVTRAGMALVMFTPVAFVDVTSAWRLRSKWQRILVSASGMYAEIFVAALAAIIWSTSNDPVARRLANDVVLIASVNTILFNLNPLMRFDGYFILADLIGQPNLQSRGQEYVAWLMQRHLLGHDVPHGEPTGVVPWAVRWHGLVAACWRIFVVVSITLAAVGWLSWLGGGLAAVYWVVWSLPNLERRWRVFRRNGSRTPCNPRRLAWSWSLASAVACGAYWVLARPGEYSAPMVVEFVDEVLVRADSPGFVREIRVRNGDLVRVGDPLLVLENETLVAQLEDLSLSYRQSELKSRSLLHEKDLASQQAETANGRALTLKCREVRRRVDGLVIRAGRAGRFCARRLEDLLGSRLETGAIVGVIGADEAKKLMIAIPQDDVASFELSRGQDLLVEWESDSPSPLHAALHACQPSASTVLTHPAFSALVGGALPVIPPRQAQPGGEVPAVRLATPVFEGTILLDPIQSRNVRTGQRGRVSFRAATKSVGERWFDALCRWMGEQVRAARESS